MASLLILNYHRITRKNESVDPRYRPFTIRESDLEDHFQLIHDLNIPVIALSELPNTTISGLCVAITFDDGHRSDVEMALPLLKKFDFSATFFPVVHHINKEGYVSWEALHLLRKEGHTIGSHGLTHRHLSRLTNDDVSNELLTSKQLLEKELGSTIRLFSFPYGDYTRKSITLMLEAGYTHGVSTSFGFNQSADEMVLLKRWNIKQTTSTNELKRVFHGSLLTLARHGLTSKLSRSFLRIQRNITP